MARSWAELSKKERRASGKTKKEHNRSTGNSKIPKFNGGRSSWKKAKDKSRSFSNRSMDSNNAPSRPAESRDFRNSPMGDNTMSVAQAEELVTSRGASLSSFNDGAPEYGHWRADQEEAFFDHWDSPERLQVAAARSAAWDSLSPDLARSIRRSRRKEMKNNGGGIFG